MKNIKVSTLKKNIKVSTLKKIKSGIIIELFIKNIRKELRVIE